MKHYSADVYVNGEFRYGCTADSMKDALAEANHHADWMKKREAAISKALKIRNNSRVEVKAYRQTLGSQPQRMAHT